MKDNTTQVLYLLLIFIGILIILGLSTLFGLSYVLFNFIALFLLIVLFIYIKRVKRAKNYSPSIPKNNSDNKEKEINFLSKGKPIRRK